MKISTRLLKRTITVIFGYLLYKYFRIRYGKNVFIFLCRGKTGDAFLYFRYLKSYLIKNHIEKYILAGDGKNIKKILNLYPDLKAPCIEISEKKALYMQNAYCFIGGEKLRCAHLLMWDQELLYNRCVIGKLEPFHWGESFYWFLFDLNKADCHPQKAVFPAITDKVKAYLDKIGVVEGKSVIFSPFSYCVKLLPVEFWQILAKELTRKGYHVFVMLDESKEKNVFGLPSIFFKYEDSQSVLEYAGFFIGLRSGFCDIIAQIECKKVFLYPPKEDELDYWNHRSDMEFSSVKTMGLGEAWEVVIPFARSISSNEPITESLGCRISEDLESIQKILKIF